MVSSLTLVAINGHEAVSLVVPALGGIGAVNRNLVVVGTQTMTVGVRVGEQATLLGGGSNKSSTYKRTWYSPVAIDFLNRLPVWFPLATRESCCELKWFGIIKCRLRHDMDVDVPLLVRSSDID